MSRYRCATCGSFSVVALGTTDESARYAYGSCANCGRKVSLSMEPVEPVKKRVKANAMPEPAFPGHDFRGSLTSISPFPWGTKGDR